MCDADEAEQQTNVFVSAKTKIGIPVRHAALRDALIQASLDPKVRSIDYIASAEVPSSQVALDAVIVNIENDAYVLDVVPARRLRGIEDEGLVLIALDELQLKPLVLTAEDILREPRRANANLVWSHNDVTVPVGLRLRILEILLDAGPIPLGQLLKSLADEQDPAPAVMALACANLVQLDLFSQPLSPTTLVKCNTQVGNS